MAWNIAFTLPPVFSVDTPTTPGAGAAVLVGNTAQVIRSNVALPSPGALTIAGLAPLTKVAYTLVPQAGALTLAGQSANLGGGPTAVTNFQMARQGDVNNGNQSPNGHVYTITWQPPSSGTPDHYQIQRSVDYGAFTDYATVSGTTLIYTDNAATNAYNAANIAEQNDGSVAGGQTTIYQYQVLACADVAGSIRGPAAPQFTMWHYNGQAAAAWSGATAYNVGDQVAVSGTRYFCINANTNNTPPNASFWDSLTGGATASGPNNSYELSFGFTSIDYADTTGAPPNGGTCIKLVDNGGFVAGLQYATGNPRSQNYGGEVGMFNYITFSLKPMFTGTFEFAIFSRSPNGDTSAHSNVSINAYGPTPTSGVWGTYKIPLSALCFTTPAGGITVFKGSITNGVMTVTQIISGPGIDPTCWIDGPGVSAGTWVSQTPGQTGTGTYTVTTGVAGTPANVPAGTTMTCRHTNFYKTAIKRVGASAGEVWYVADIGFLLS